MFSGTVLQSKCSKNSRLQFCVIPLFRPNFRGIRQNPKPWSAPDEET